MVLPAEFTNINIVCQELSDGRMLITSEGGGLAIGRPGKYQFATPRNGLPDSQSALVDVTAPSGLPETKACSVSPVHFEWSTGRATTVQTERSRLPD